MKGWKVAARAVIRWAEKAKDGAARTWMWEGTKRLGDYVPECSCLANTNIQMAGAWEGSTEVCAYVSAACQYAPTLAKACVELQARLDAAMAENDAMRWYVARDDIGLGDVIEMYKRECGVR